MKNMSITDVVSHLIGYTEPFGDSEVDKIRLENQKEAIQLCKDIIETLQINAKYYNSEELSMSTIGRSAMVYLCELRINLEEYIKENKKSENNMLRYSDEPFRFNSGDKVKVVSSEQCRLLDIKYCHKRDHSFMGGKEVTIDTVLNKNTSSFQVYTIAEVEGYYWEDEYFE